MPEAKNSFTSKTTQTSSATMTSTETKPPPLPKHPEQQYPEALKAQARAYALSSTTSSANNRDRYRTPSFRPTVMLPPPNGRTTTPFPQPPAVVTATAGGARRNAPQGAAAPPPPPVEEDDYQRFVRSLGTKWDDDMVSLPSMAALLKPLADDEDDDEFQLTEESEDDDDEDEELSGEESQATLGLPSEISFPGEDSASQSWDAAFCAELEAELGSLLEEDLEAAVTTLLGTNDMNFAGKAGDAAAAGAGMGKASDFSSAKGKKGRPPTPTAAASVPSPQTPLRSAARQASQTVVSARQVKALQSLMAQHYQLLLQQTILAIRTAQNLKADKAAKKEELGGNESAEDLAEIIDGAVGMLQDLDQNRKDAIRNFIQMEASKTPGSVPTSGKRSLLPQLAASTETPGSNERRLTRAAFQQTLEGSDTSRLTRKTTFDVPGISCLKTTFATMDNTYSQKKNGGIDIAAPMDHAEACRLVLKQAGALYEESLLPGVGDVSQLLSDPKEVFGPSFFPPASREQFSLLRRTRNQFTAAEDNLVLRGVNLYGEKQWLLIADRYLPDRSVNIISQRYSKLCLMIYRANGISIDPHGNLIPPPKDMKLELLDEDALSKLKKVEPPAILNVHRWSIEEDLTLLKAVPLLGHMWAELSSRLIPHRDRGHLRKRYQVLERRVKATVARSKRDELTPGRTVVARLPARQQPSPMKSVVAAKASLVDKKRGSPVAAKGASPLPHPGAPTRGSSVPPRVPQSVSKAKPSVGNGNSVRASFARRGASHPVGSPLGEPAPPSLGGSFLDSHSGGAEGSTQTGFERILGEGTDDWSQMSRLKRIIENDPESLVACAAVSHFAKNAGREHLHAGRSNQMERLPTIDMNSNASSGLSLLANTQELAAHGPESYSSPTKRPRSDVAGAKPPANGQKLSPSQQGVGNDTSGFSITTPSRGPTISRMPTFGTPTPAGFSPAVRNMYSPALKNGYSPGAGLKSCFSPATNSMMNMPPGASSDGFDFCNFEISDRSRQALEANNDHALGQSGAYGGLTTFSHPPTPSNHDVLDEGLKPTDLEAISALNSLSNSPARYLTKRRATEISADDEERSSSSFGGPKKSLFAAVIGGVEKKETQKKRRTS